MSIKPVVINIGLELSTVFGVVTAFIIIHILLWLKII